MDNGFHAKNRPSLEIGNLPRWKVRKNDVWDAQAAWGTSRSNGGPNKDCQEQISTEIEAGQEEMKATVRVSQEKMEAAINSIHSEV